MNKFLNSTIFSKKKIIQQTNYKTLSRNLVSAEIIHLITFDKQLLNIMKIIFYFRKKNKKTKNFIFSFYKSLFIIIHSL